MKVLIIEPTFTPHPTDTDLGPVHHEQGSFPDVDKDTARKLVDAGKALYTAKTDDPYKGLKTAPSELIDAAVRAAKEAARTAKEAAKSAPAADATA